MSDGMAGFIAASMSPETPQSIAMEFKMTEAQQRAYDQAQVMLAFSHGKKVQWKFRGRENWNAFSCEPTPAWDWTYYDYRIAPEPQEVWLWVKWMEEGKGLPMVCVVGTSNDGFLEGQGYTKKLFREVY